MSGPDRIVEAGAHVLSQSDSFGCGCCSSGGEDRHDDGTTCRHEYCRDCPGGAQLWTRVIAAVRPLIEVEVRELGRAEANTARLVDVIVAQGAIRIARGGGQ